MDITLAHLREIVSNYTDDHTEGKAIYQKLVKGHYPSEEAFVRDLSQNEINFLNTILPHEINYAHAEQDDKRANQLNEVFELLI